MLRNFVKQLKTKKTVRSTLGVQPHEIAESEEKDYKKNTDAYQNDSNCPPTDKTPQYHIHKCTSRDTSRDTSSQNIVQKDKKNSI
jgi:hypothetical protein